MIKYKVAKSDEEYTVEVKGHANQNPYGSDIVCASVSTMLIMTLNLMEKLELLGCNITNPICDEGKFQLHINMSNDTAIKIVDNLIESLDMLSKSYPKNIKYEK